VGRLLLLMVLAPCLSGCAASFIPATYITGGALKSGFDRGVFTADFKKQNLERQKAGLPPLDWCAEIYRTRSRWYAWDGSCLNGPEATKVRKIGASPPDQGPAVTPSPVQSPYAI